jgi:hypothetical protein
MPRIIGTIAATLAIVALAGFVIAGLGDGTTSYEGTTQLQGARVAIEQEDGTTTLVADGLPRPEGGDVYKAWLACPGTEAPEPSVAFQPRDGSAATQIPDVCTGVESVLLTREDDPESTAPTEDPVAEIRLAASEHDTPWFSHREPREYQSPDEAIARAAGHVPGKQEAGEALPTGAGSGGRHGEGSPDPAADPDAHAIHTIAAPSAWNEGNHFSQPTSDILDTSNERSYLAGYRVGISEQGPAVREASWADIACRARACTLAGTAGAQRWLHDLSPATTEVEFPASADEQRNQFIASRTGDGVNEHAVIPDLARYRVGLSEHPAAFAQPGMLLASGRAARQDVLVTFT